MLEIITPAIETSQKAAWCTAGVQAFRSGTFKSQPFGKRLPDLG